MEDKVLSFTDFVSLNNGVDEEKFWEFCRQDLRSEKTGDIWWHGTEIEKKSDKAGYIEDWEAVLEDWEAGPQF